MSNIFRGLGVALITPFKSDMSIDFEALERLVNYQLDNGADFLCILATTGETPCLTRSEKDEITRVVKSVVKGRVPLLKYCGGNNTRAVIEEMKSSDWEGIDGILSICPYYNKPSQEGLYQHFKAIAEASPLPLVLYNVPGRTGVNMKAATTCRIAKDFPNIVGIKEASGSLEQVDEIIKNKPEGFEVISGDDALTFADCVREESRTYPRPMPIESLENDPFRFSEERILRIWDHVRADIEQVVASNGDIFFYSTRYLTPEYAASLAEWAAVERLRNV